jgi:hypothetical protein
MDRKRGIVFLRSPREPREEQGTFCKAKIIVR